MMREYTDSMINQLPLDLQPTDIFAIRVPHTGIDKIEQPGSDSPGLQYAMTPLIKQIIENNANATSFHRDNIIYQPSLRNDRSKNELINKLKTYMPKYVFLSSVSAAQPYSYEIAKIVKMILPDATIIEGGRHIKETQNYLGENKFGSNVIKSDILQNFRHGSPVIDQLAGKVERHIAYFLSGEGEYSTLALVKLLEFARKHNLDQKVLFKQAMDNGYFESVKGISSIATVSHNNNVIFAPVGKKKLALKDIPSPYDYFTVTSRFNVFPKKTGGYKKTAHVMFERGCPYNCIYCSEALSSQGIMVSILDNDFKKHVYNQVVKALLAGGEAFFDDSPTFARGNSQMAREIYEVIKAIKIHGIVNHPELKEQINQLERGMQLTANEPYKLQSQKPTLGQKLVEVGMTYVFIGIESLDAGVMANIQKEKYKREYLGSRFEKVKGSLQIIKSWGVKNIGASFQFGLPGSSRKTWKVTIDKAVELLDEGLLSMVSQNIVTIHPQTQIGLTDPKSGRLDYTQGSEYSYPFDQFDEAHPRNIISGITTEDIERINNETKEKRGGFQQMATISRNKKYDKDEERKDINIEEIGKYSTDRENIINDELLNKYRNHQGVDGLYFNNAYMGRLLKKTYRELESGYHKLPLVEKARFKAGQIVNIHKKEKVILTRNTTEGLKLIYRLAGMNQGGDVIVSNQENWATYELFKYHIDFGNTKKKDISSTYPDDIIAENYLGTDKITDIQGKHTIYQVPFGCDASDITNVITDKTKMIVLSCVSRIDGKVWDITSISREIKSYYPHINIIVDGAQALGGNIEKIDFSEREDNGIDALVSTSGKHLNATSLGLVYISDKFTTPESKSNLLGLEQHEQVLMKGMIWGDPYINVHESLSNSRLYAFESAIQSAGIGNMLEGCNFNKKHEYFKKMKGIFIKKLQLYNNITIFSEGNDYAPGIVTWRINDDTGLKNKLLIQRLYSKESLIGSYVPELDAIRTSFGTNNTQGDIEQLFEMIDFIDMLDMRSNNIIDGVLKFISNKERWIGSVAATILLIIGLHIVYQFAGNNNIISKGEKDFLSEFVAENYDKFNTLSRKHMNIQRKIMTNIGYKKDIARFLSQLDDENIVSIAQASWIGEEHLEPSAVVAIKIANKIHPGLWNAIKEKG